MLLVILRMTKDLRARLPPEPRVLEVPWVGLPLVPSPNQGRRRRQRPPLQGGCLEEAEFLLGLPWLLLLLLVVLLLLLLVVVVFLVVEQVVKGCLVTLRLLPSPRPRRRL